VNAQHLVVERGDAVKRYIGFCGGPALGRGCGRGALCVWQSDPLPAGELAERAVLEHYRTEHPTLLAKVSAGALNGKLVRSSEPMVSRIDLSEDEDD
jgi:hypothetical protein